MKCMLRWLNAVDNQQVPDLCPLLQNPAYGQAIAETTHFKPRPAIIEMDGQPAGYALFLEVKALFGLMHGLVLDRGPLWFEGFGGIAHIKNFFDYMDSRWPARLGRRRRIMPEIEDGITARKVMEQCGLTRQGDGYQTFLLDLSPDEGTLRDGLHQKWRNTLNKAEKHPGLFLEWDRAAGQLPWFLKVYERDRRQKNYSGPSPQFLTALARLSPQQAPMIMGRVIKDGAAISAVAIAIHGLEATYLAGWTGAEGRQFGGHHLLLWNAALMLKQQGVSRFDLGGFDDTHGQGIAHFKEGMGGRRYRLVGHYS